MALISSDGRILDEHAVAPRVEQISIAIHLDGSPEPASVSTTGDRQARPSPRERDEATALAEDLHESAREAAAQRRFSTAGQLADYLRWRLSTRAGELLILDLYLARDDASDGIKFLLELDRPIRGLTASIRSKAKPLLAQHPQLDIRLLPQGRRALHDRVWLMGETGLLIGGSANTFLPAAGGTGPATTAVEMPAGDALAWRAQFERWWPR